MEKEEDELIDGKLDDYVIAKKLLQLKQSATSRGIDFDLSFKTVKKLLMQKKCFYTNKNLTTVGLTRRSIDRVDTSIGYIEGNVVACTVDINSKKSNLSVSEIFLMAKKIKKHKNKTKKG